MREYHCPDFMPALGEAVLVRASHTAPWMLATFHAYWPEDDFWRTAEGGKYRYCAKIEYADVEPWRPGNEVDSFSSLVSNSLKGPFYLRKVFWSERARRWQAEDGSKYLHCAQVPMRVLRGEYRTPPVIYTKEDQPLLGQPILVSDDAGEWHPRLYAYYNASAEFPWHAGDRNWKYAAQYDEQFWLAQQEKKAEPVDAGKQAEKLAEALASNCVHNIDCGIARAGACLLPHRPCRRVIKDDWLAYASEQED